MIAVDCGGQARLNKKLIAKAAGVGDTNSPEDPLKVINYIYSNEGLLLLVQVTEGRYRYRLHIGEKAPTRGKDVKVQSILNYDNNYDNRINPRRPAGNKFDVECPPYGFDSLIAMNPAVSWLDPITRQSVSTSQIAFHELAESHARLELGLEYLSSHVEPGAHDLAIGREAKLEAQRPLSGIMFFDAIKSVSKGKAKKQSSQPAIEAFTGSKE
jgi:hypothetical protein